MLEDCINGLLNIPWPSAGLAKILGGAGEVELNKLVLVVVLLLLLLDEKRLVDDFIGDDELLFWVENNPVDALVLFWNKLLELFINGDDDDIVEDFENRLLAPGFILLFELDFANKLLD